MRIVLAMLLLLGISACSQVEKVSPPASEQILAETCQTLRDFVATHLNKAKVAEAKQDLEVLMESVQAQADQFGGKLNELQAATQKLLEQLQANPNVQTMQDHLKEFEQELNRLHPVP